MNATNDPQRQSWVASANRGGNAFPIQNLPFGVFASADAPAIGVAIGDQVLNLRGCADLLPAAVQEACAATTLNPLMAGGGERWAELRAALSDLLRADHPQAHQNKQALSPHLLPMAEVSMLMPAVIGNYTDFYASIHHATRVGKLFRPDNPLLPNYKYVPIGYHGRASSIVVSGQEIRRPSGQTKSGSSEPIFGSSRSLDYELEVGAFIGPGNNPGQPIPIEEAEQHIFGLCLLNDWSARDIQSWEYQPLGPFLAKNFGTSISPWVVPMAALEPYRVCLDERPSGDPSPLPHLTSTTPESDGIDLTLEVSLQSQRMRDEGIASMSVSKGNLRDLYWSIRQMVTHHSSNGCNLRTGDLLATGTVSGPAEGSEGCLLEMKHRSSPLQLPTGETRTSLEDGDQVTFRACAQKDGSPRIGFGE